MVRWRRELVLTSIRNVGLKKGDFDGIRKVAQCGNASIALLLLSILIQLLSSFLSSTRIWSQFPCGFVHNFFAMLFAQILRANFCVAFHTNMPANCPPNCSPNYLPNFLPEFHWMFCCNSSWILQLRQIFCIAINRLIKNINPNLRLKKQGKRICSRITWNMTWTFEGKLTWKNN